MAISPASMITTEITAENTGRSIKKREITGLFSCGLSGTRRGNTYRAVRAHLGQALDHHGPLGLGRPDPRRGALGLLVDRDALGTAPLFPFFGEPAPVPSGAVDLALRMDSPMFIAWTPRTRWGRYSLYVEQVPMPTRSGDHEADMARGMAAMVGALEAGIRRWPDQWFPISPVWPLRDAVDD